MVWCRDDLVDTVRTEFVRSPAITRGAEIGQFDYVVEQHRFEAGNPNFLGLWVLRRSAEWLLSIGLPAIEGRIHDLTESLLERI